MFHKVNPIARTIRANRGAYTVIQKNGDDLRPDCGGLRSTVEAEDGQNESA